MRSGVVRKVIFATMVTLNSEYKPQNINLVMRKSEQPNLDLVVT